MHLTSPQYMKKKEKKVISTMCHWAYFLHMGPISSTWGLFPPHGAYFLHMEPITSTPNSKVLCETLLEP